MPPLPGVLLLVTVALAGFSQTDRMAFAQPAAERGGETDVLDMGTVNALSPEAFLRTFGGVFENSPWVAERAASARPFASPAALHTAMMGVVRVASPAEILAFLNAHPDLAGTEARARRMTAHSSSEQGSAGLDTMTDEDVERFGRLNAAYRETFGFPFIIAVRGRTKAEIVSEFERRLAHPRDVELEAALAEIAVITRMRLERMLGRFG